MSEAAQQKTEVKVEVEEPIRVPRDPLTGGISEALPFRDLIRLYAKRTDWTPRPGRYYFSGIGQCFAKLWYEEKNKAAKAAGKDLPYPPEKPDKGPGWFEGGNAAENHILHMMRAVYGEEGSVLKHVRFSRVIGTGSCANCGHRMHAPISSIDTERCGSGCECASAVEDQIALIGRTDPLLIGDNFEPLQFMEVKSWAFGAPRKAKEVIDKYGHTVPLNLVGIETPAEQGLVNINQAMQLAVGVKFLADKGLDPKKKNLHYTDRSDLDVHIEVLFSNRDIDILYDLSEWWVLEHHENLKQDKPPVPFFFMGWECRYCPFAAQCAKDTKKAGTDRRIHPVMLSINAQLKTEV